MQVAISIKNTIYIYKKKPLIIKREGNTEEVEVAAEL